MHVTTPPSLDKNIFLIFFNILISGTGVTCYSEMDRWPLGPLFTVTSVSYKTITYGSRWSLRRDNKSAPFREDPGNTKNFSYFWCLPNLDRGGSDLKIIIFSSLIDKFLSGPELCDSLSARGNPKVPSQCFPPQPATSVSPLLLMEPSQALLHFNLLKT